MSEPRTEAGRRLVEELCTCGGPSAEFVDVHATWCMAWSVYVALPAIEREAAAPQPLDVDRLARILKAGNIGCEDHSGRDGGYHLASSHKEDAEFIAAEYARLSRKEPSARDAALAYGIDTGSGDQQRRYIDRVTGRRITLEPSE